MDDEVTKPVDVTKKEEEPSDDEERGDNSVSDDTTADLISSVNDEPGCFYVIEPAIVLIFVASSLFETIIPNAIEERFCMHQYNLTYNDCFKDSNPHKADVQQFATNFGVLRTIIEVSIPSFMTFFVGPWSDTYGRRPLMLASTFGFATSYYLWLVLYGMQSLNPLFLLIISFPFALCGAATVFILASFCYVCDVSSLENRAMRLGLLQASLFMGNFIGTAICHYLSSRVGYRVIFGISASCAVAACFYIYYFVKESVVPTQIQRNTVKKNPFHFDHVKELFTSCYTKQTPRVRLIVALLIMVLTCSLINIFGELGVLYLFLQNILSWDLAEFTTLSLFTIMVNAIGAFGGTWLLCNKLKFNDLFILSIAGFLRILSALVMVFGYRIWHIYFSKLLACTLGFSGPLIRSYISRIIPPDELGKIFSLLSSGESMTPLVATLMYSSVYKSTLNTYPEAIFLLSALILLIMLLLLACIVKLHFDKSPEDRNQISSHTPSINA